MCITTTIDSVFAKHPIRGCLIVWSLSTTGTQWAGMGRASMGSQPSVTLAREPEITRMFTGVGNLWARGYGNAATLVRSRTCMLFCFGSPGIAFPPCW